MAATVLLLRAALLPPGLRLLSLFPPDRLGAAVPPIRRSFEPLPVGYATPSSHLAPRRSKSLLRLALVGRMVLDKGVHDAVEVLAALANRGVNAELTLTGSGPATTSVLGLARKLDVAGRVQHIPWLDPPGLADLYRRTDVVLAPSRSTPTWVEQFGRMIVQTQACGCVVAGYVSGSIPEVGGEQQCL